MGHRKQHARAAAPVIQATTASRSRLAQRRADGGVPPIVSDVLRGPSRPLDADTRAFMEPRFGRDLSHVRIHDDARAGESAQAIGARAYTAGADVVLDPARYQPRSDVGQRLLAHELTHVAQQGDAAPAATTSFLLAESPAREREADSAAHAITRGLQPTQPVQAGIATGGLQRDMDTDDAANAGGGGGGKASASCIEAIVGEDPSTLVEAGYVTIIEFGAEWCGPCRMTQASLEQMCKEFKQNPPKAPVRMFTVDVDAEGNEELAKRYTDSHVPHIYFYVGSKLKDHYATGLEPDFLDAYVKELIDEASQSSTLKGAKQGARLGSLIGLGLGVLGAIGVGVGLKDSLSGNELLGAILGTIAGGAGVGAGIGAGIGALVGHANEDKPGSRRRKKPQPKRRDGISTDPDEIAADAMAARVLRESPGLASHASSGPAGSLAGGAPMDTALRLEMESHFGRDFSHVRVHRDASADRVAAGMQAFAVTDGPDIYFARDGYAPETPSGRAILAHELAHVVQQDVPGPSASTASLESEAARASVDVAHGHAVSIQHGAAGAPAPLPITRAQKTALGALIGISAGAAAGALIGLAVASQMKGTPYGAGAGWGALIGGGVGLITGLIVGAFTRRTDRVGAQEADMLIRRRYGKYLPDGVPAPLRNATVRAVTNAQMHERFICYHGHDNPDLLGFTDTGPLWREGKPPDPSAPPQPLDPGCHGVPMEPASPDHPVIYYPNDSPDAGILVHEGLHAMASPEYQRLFNFVVEGTTEMYTRRLLADVNIAVYSGGYDDNVREVERFEAKVGEDVLAKAYFAGEIDALDRAATSVLGPCALTVWAVSLTANNGSNRLSNSVIDGGRVDHCAQLQQQMPYYERGQSLAAPPAAAGTGAPTP
jgi:thiol-disulfide isomerase/thioredoxin